MPAHFFYGSTSIDYSTAQKADIRKQNFTSVPRFWYIDASLTCHDCKRAFVFSADEQRYWYEELRFYVPFLPKRCATCRQIKRTKRELRKRYDAIIKIALSRNCSLDEKRQAIDHINELEATEERLPDKLIQHRAMLAAQIRNEVERR